MKNMIITGYKKVTLILFLVFISGLAKPQSSINMQKINLLMEVPDYPTGVFTLLEKDNYSFSRMITSDSGLNYYVYGFNQNNPEKFIVFISIAGDEENRRQIQYQFRRNDANIVFDNLIKEIKSKCTLFDTEDFYRTQEKMTIKSYTYKSLNNLYFTFHSYLNMEDKGVVNDLYISNFWVEKNK